MTHDVPAPPRPRPVLPAFPAPEASGGFPIVASIAPVVAAGAIFAVTRSPFALLFAVAAPLAALGGLLDRRIRRRRADRRTAERFGRALDRLDEELERSRSETRAARDRAAPDPARLATGSLSGIWSGGPEPIRVGRAEIPSEHELGDGEDAPPAFRRRIADLVSGARWVPGAPIALSDEAIGVVGSDPMRSAVVRALVVQFCASVPPDGAVLRAPATEHWARSMPHEVVASSGSGLFELERGGLRRRVIGAETEARLPAGLGSVLHVPDGAGAALIAGASGAVVRDLELVMLSTGTAESIARRLSALASDASHGRALPVRVELGALPTASAPTAVGRVAGLAAPIGADEAGAVWADLVADGPHAVVGGTTGSGKSELLVAWILSMAERHPPSEVTFLLIDFKGGASFAPLVPLPHVVGVVSDLDASTARRAVTSLRSEVLRREALLAEAGGRDVSALPETPRLVVVVDEYAALVAEQPELHDLVADLASRGRSLGIHLILCTQRPGGIVREQVLANAGLRLSLRVNNRADSLAVLGDDAAAQLAGAPPGRALLLGADGRIRPFQCALAVPADVDRVGRAWEGAAPPSRPWAEPLPSRVEARSLDAPRDGIPFGLVDLPEQQRLAVAAYAPDRDGNLLVIGGRRAGTSSALATLGRGLGTRALLAPAAPADAWSVLARTLEDGDGRDGRVVILDDVDLLLDGADDDERAGFVRLLAGLARELPARGGALILGASRMPTAATALMARMDSRLLLALPDREQHVLAGGEARDWTPRRPPGRGRWHGRDVQVAVVDSAPAPAEVEVREHRLELARPPAIVASVPHSLEASLTAAGFEVVDPGSPPAPGRAIVGDPDEWLAAWSAFETARREADVLVVGCAAADIRSLVRSRADAPPLDPRQPEAWLLRSRRLERVRVPWLGRS